MNISEILSKGDFTCLTGNAGLDKVASGVYCSDLLSLVMAKASHDSIWITAHAHPNIISVALLNDLSCIIIPEGLTPEKVTIEKAKEDGIAILSSHKTAYDICCRLNEILL